MDIVYRFNGYGVATISRLLKNYRSLLQNIVSFIGLFCKETNHFKEPTNRSHTIPYIWAMGWLR